MKRNLSGPEFVESRSEPEPMSGCWLWLGASNRQGYGVTTRVRHLGTQLAHRLSYEAFCGTIPSGLHVLHNCDNPPCVNPRHLRTGTDKDNVADSIARGRWGPARAGERNGRAKLTRPTVAAIRARYAAGGIAQDAIASEYGVSQSIVSGIVRGASWR